MRTIVHGNEVYTEKWIKHFFSVAEKVSELSTCLSRQVGAVLVKDKVIVATGFNGPPRGYPHCSSCPRRAMTDYENGKYLEFCPAVHAEINCIASAARIGAGVRDSTLFLNTQAPCKSCLATLINAGVIQVFALGGWYDRLSMTMEPLIRVNILSIEELEDGESS